MDGLIIRQARSDDLANVVQLWLQMVQFHADRDPRLAMRTDAEGLETMRTYLQAGLENPDARLFVAEMSGQEGLAGYLLAYVRPISPLAIPPTSGYISDICVEEQTRRHGIGRALYQAARDWFRERGQTMIRLNIATANPVSQAFWRAVGFSELMVVMAVEV